MTKILIRRVIETSVITAFTIATAFIWKDVIIDFIKLFVPPGEEIYYKFLTAVIATFILIIAIYIVLKTEAETEVVIKKIKKKKRV